MQAVKIVLWVLAGLAATGWFLCLAAEVTLAFGRGALALWVEHTMFYAGPFVFAPLFIVFVPALLVGARLAPSRMGNAYFATAMRGSPLWLRAGMWATAGVVAVIAVIRLLAALADPQAGFNINFSMALLAAFYAISCGILVSGARLGLRHPVCPNGHPVAHDMTHCSLCGAAIRNVVS